MSNVSLFFPYFMMATIRVFGSFVSFNLPLADQGYVNVSEDLLNLRFNLCIGTMYVEQEISSMDGDILEIILLQKTMKVVILGFWVLGYLEL